MITLLLPAILFGWLVYALDHAPEGYQDEDGFHFGRPSRIRFQQDEGTVPRALARTTGLDGSQTKESALL
jgi:hypothetical protein